MNEPTGPGHFQHCGTVSAEQRTASARDYESATDLTVIEACQRGETFAWEVLFARHRKSIYETAYRLTANADDAADITAIVLLRVFNRLDTFKTGGSFLAWLKTVTRNVFIDTCARPAARLDAVLGLRSNPGNDSEILAVEDPSPTPEQLCIEAYLASIRRKHLRAAVAYLPRYQRIMIRMHHAEGFSHREIAERTGIAIGTIKSRLHRARQELRDRLLPVKSQILDTSTEA